MLNKNHFFTAFFLTSITCMMFTVAEPRENTPENKNSPIESDKPVRDEKKIAPAFENEELLKPIVPQSRQFRICFARKPKEKLDHVASQRRRSKLV